MAGRPSPIDAVVRHRNDGSPMTVADVITDALLAGNYFEHACASAGITKETGYEWLRVAGRALITAKGRPLTTVKLDAHQKRCIAFSDAVANAESTWVVRANTTLELLARGGIPQETVTIERGPAPVAGNGGPVYDADGNEVLGPILKQSTRTTHTLPDAQVLMWRLTRRFPSLYGNRLTVDTPGSALSERERAAALLEGLEEFFAEVPGAAALEDA